MQTRPYPFDRWPKLSRAQLRAVATLRSHFDTPERAAALGCASTLLAAPVSATICAVEAREASELQARLTELGPCVVLVLEAADGGVDDVMLLELSGTFAEHLVDRALGGDTPALAPSAMPADELSQGVLAYLAARCLAALGGAMRLRHVTADARSLSGGLGTQPWLLVSFETRVGEASGSVRLYLRDLRGRVRERPALHKLAELPLTLVAEIGRATLRSSEFASLRRRDILVLDACALYRDAQHWRGRIDVNIRGGGSHLVCQICDQGLQVERRSSATEPAMTTGRRSQPPSARAEASEPVLEAPVPTDAPLEIHVELARFSLTLGELQRTTTGDVLLTGQRIGEGVTLRVGGRAIARADLVDVEGEVGVRITQFLTPETESA